MSFRAELNAYSAWSSVKMSPRMATDNILQSITKGNTMRVLLESVTGQCPKRLGSLDGLTESQKVTRAEWFMMALRDSKMIPNTLKVNMEMFSKGSKAHVFPVLWELVGNDIMTTWTLSKILQSDNDVLVIAEPFMLGPHKIYNPDEITQFHLDKEGRSITESHKRKKIFSYAQCLKSMITLQLEFAAEPAAQEMIESWEDLLNSKIWCGLVNSFIPGTFTTEVLLNDRWFINLALDAATRMFKINCSVDSEDLCLGSSNAISTFLTCFFLCGFQLRQALAVVKRMDYLQEKLECLQREYSAWENAQQIEVCDILKRKELEANIKSIEIEMEWTSKVYDIEACAIWKEQVVQEQLRVRKIISQKMKDRFDIVILPRPSTIRELVENLVINLSLTGENGFYLSDGKERWWPDRKIVIRDIQTGEFFDDFSASSTDRALVTCREMLGLPANEVVEVAPEKYPRYELYFESTSRNKMLKGGTKFLYQVVPGTSDQCQRLLLRSARYNDLTSIKKLVVFFESKKSFVNSQDILTGNTALHIAARHGHMEVAEYLLQHKADVNGTNLSGATPLFLAVESIHKEMCQLLLEWKADIKHKNKQSKTVLNLIRNVDLKELIKTKNEQYISLREALTCGDITQLIKLLEGHCSGKPFLVSLKSRFCKGCTVFHIAAKFGSVEAVQMCISLRIDVNILNAQGATPLHLTQSPEVIEVLIEAGATVNAITVNGNTVLHLLCKLPASSVANIDACIPLLVKHGALLTIRNTEGFLPIHCAAVAGDCTKLSLLLELDSNSGGKMKEALTDEMIEPKPPSLLHLSIINNHLEAAKLLEKAELDFKEGEVDRLSALLLTCDLTVEDPVQTYKFLLSHGASTGDEEFNPLCLAAMQASYPEFVQLLLDQGANPNTADAELGTPLFCACKANNPAAASILLKAKADHSIRNAQGQTPFDVISEHEEWIRSGYFDKDTQARLKAYSLKSIQQLVRNIENKLRMKQGYSLVAIVTGVPFLLLSEPFPNKKINFTKIKPLLDQFQG